MKLYHTPGYDCFVLIWDLEQVKAKKTHLVFHIVAVAEYQVFYEANEIALWYFLLIDAVWSTFFVVDLLFSSLRTLFVFFWRVVL